MECAAVATVCEERVMECAAVATVCEERDSQMQSV